MAKPGGGTRNYRNKPSAMNSRRTEFDTVLSLNNYRESYFDDSGGFYVIHEQHNAINHIGERGEGNDNDNREDEGARQLALKGYKIFLMGENSYIEGLKKYDGFVGHAMIDMKTINTAGKYRIQNVLKNAGKQGAEIAILVQNTPAMTQKYIEEQIADYKLYANKEERGRLSQVWVVGISGRIHRRKINEA